MEDTARHAVAIVGLGAILPDAPEPRSFWSNLRDSRYSISEVTPERWDPALYYDPDPRAPDKTYSKIGGWVRRYEWDPQRWKLGGIPPRVADAMDDAQKWALACTHQALADYGFPERSLDRERTAVILGNAMAGEKHYATSLRINLPDVERALESAKSFEALPREVRASLTAELEALVARRYPPVTEDTMPGELANCIAGRVANLFNFRGPNFVCDAACASAMAALSAAVEGLAAGDFDAAVSGGIDRNMGAATFVKFCKIGALSATGTRPYADGADGFVMGEGAVVFLLKRLRDAEAAGDKVYAVLRGIAGASDGKGKGITAPNPVGQRLAVERAWRNAGLDPGSCSLVEGHGTSTRVGDVVEVESLAAAFGNGDGSLPPRSVPLGSVKSNIGHLKGAAGAAGILKAALALHHGELPASLHFAAPNPSIDFAHSPFYVNTERREWPLPACGVRRAGVSAFGFGGTNFHAVLEEFVPGSLDRDRRSRVAVHDTATASASAWATAATASPRHPMRGTLVLGAGSRAELAARLDAAAREASLGRAPAPVAPLASDLCAAERIAIDFGSVPELADKAARARTALERDGAASWRALQAQGVFRGRGARSRVAFLFTGQGSQYVNMLRGLREAEPIVAETFAEADRALAGLLEQSLAGYLDVDPADARAVARAEEALKQTAVTQPAVLAVDTALTRLLASYGVQPEMVIGHSLGEYGALVAAGVLPFAHALEAVSARGREMARVSVADNGRMAAVIAPLPAIERVLAGFGGEVVVANYNSRSQSVIGGASAPVEAAVAALLAAGFNAVLLPVSHAFHTRIVAPASAPLREVLERLDVQPPRLPVVSNVTAGFYPSSRTEILDLLSRQVAAPVLFARGLQTLYDSGTRVFVEVGPKKALHGFVADVLGEDASVLALSTNHPKLPDATAFNQALCGLYASGLGDARSEPMPVELSTRAAEAAPPPPPPSSAEPARPPVEHVRPAGVHEQLGRLFAEFLDKGLSVYQGRTTTATRPSGPVVISGAGLGLPGLPRVFDDGNVGCILRGESLIAPVPPALREAIVRKRIVRLVKSDAGESRFASIDAPADVIKLAGRGGALDLVAEFGVPAERVESLDSVTRLAIGAGIEALRDAGLPLVLRYRTTTRGTRLPDRWALPEELCDETGVVFASAFPGSDSFADVLTRQQKDESRRERLAELHELRERAPRGELAAELDRRIALLEQALHEEPYAFDRRFLFRVLAMGHSQFAEHVGARGPNTHVNAACASTTHAVAVAEDWIRAGRCRRVVVISADDVTSDHLLEWFGSGFLASGAAATDEDVREAALPFDRRRHGMIVGMGAAALVVESAEAARERAVAPICEVLSTATANSAYHGTRLDPAHIRAVMEGLVARAERDFGVRREAIAAQTVFVSHETYTPARGGSASAEVFALREVFAAAADGIVMANTKGFTGHAMGAGIEDVVAVKSLETGLVPPIPNFRESDPELGALNLSAGGSYPVEYALRLAAGFGSQISLALLRRVPAPDGRRRAPDDLGFRYRVTDAAAHRAWLRRVSGQDSVELEVVQRTLRVRDDGALPQPGWTPPIDEPATVGPPREQPIERPLAPAPTAAATDRGTDPLTERATDPLTDRVLALVSAKTGYPPDMLALDLDLEADLGIDTVKQAELFLAVREEWGIARDDGRRLRDYPTLAHVISFVREMRPDLGAAAPASAPAAAPATEEAVAPAAPVEVASGTVDPIAQRILALVADKTGYPPDMLDLDLDLEADLGIDTVKQAELFGSVRKEWDIPRDDTRRLRDYPTLRHVVDFVYQMRPELRRAPALEATTSVVPAGAPAPAEASAVETAPAAFARRVVVPVVRPPLAACGPTGVSLAPGKRIVLMPDDGGVALELAVRLGELGTEVLLLDSSGDPAPRLAGWLATGPVHGVYWLPALDDEGELAALSPDEWRLALRRRVKDLHRTMRTLYQQVAAPGTFLVAGTRLGGEHGCGEDGASAPLGGAVCGFVKAYKRERPDALVKAVDFAAEAPTATVVERLIAETLHDPSLVEAGYAGDLRLAPALRDEPLADADAVPLGRDSVFLVTGAAGAIVSAITADLATACGGTFHLLDLVPEPERGDPDLRQWRDDREGLKRELFGRRKAAGERATPALVEQDLLALERASSALAAIEAVERAGGTAYYYSVDLRDSAGVRDACARVRERSGHVDALLHGAGLEISRLLPDKEAREFDLVFDVKADGWLNVLHGLAGTPLAATVAFSSIAGRFGNGGQTDYAAANELLAKTSASFRRTRPDTRAIVIDWTAWADLGMATRGSIPQLMAHAGIEMVPAVEAIPIVRRELTAGGTGAEIVVAGRLGSLGEAWGAGGGIDAQRERTTPGLLRGGDAAPLEGAFSFESTLDPSRQPFLNDHRIDGTPVLPGVMGIELFAEAACRLLPGWLPVEIESVEFLAPFKFYRDEPRTLTVEAVARRQGPDVVVECRLVGARSAPGSDSPQRKTHFAGSVRLARAAGAASRLERAIRPPEFGVTSDDIYRVYFHGPAYRVLESAWRDGDAAVGLLSSRLPADVEPAGTPLATAPRLLELCFQTAGLLEIGTLGRIGLPQRVDSIRLRPAPTDERGALLAVVTRAPEGGYAAHVVDESGRVHLELSGYRTVPLPGSLDAAARRAFEVVMA